MKPLANISTTLALLMAAILLLILSSCNKDDINPERPYPRVNTAPIIQATATGITYKAVILSVGASPIKEHGFVWNMTNDPRLDNSPQILLGPRSNTGEFTAEVAHQLDRGKTYYVKAFVQTESYLVYGQAQPFKLP